MLAPRHHAAGEPALLLARRAGSTARPRRGRRDLVAVGKALRQHVMLASLAFARSAGFAPPELGKPGAFAARERWREAPTAARYAALMSRILNLSEPRGAATSTVSPFFLPMIALPTGDSFESFCSAGFASAEPTIVYSTVCFASTSRSLHLRADRDDAQVDVAASRSRAR